MVRFPANPNSAKETIMQLGTTVRTTDINKVLQSDASSSGTYIVAVLAPGEYEVTRISNNTLGTETERTKGQAAGSR